MNRQTWFRSAATLALAAAAGFVGVSLANLETAQGACETAGDGTIYLLPEVEVVAPRIP